MNRDSSGDRETHSIQLRQSYQKRLRKIYQYGLSMLDIFWQRTKTSLKTSFLTTFLHQIAGVLNPQIL